MIRAIARAAVGNAVAVNLGVAAVCLAGALVYLAMPREVFPDFSLGTVSVRTIWPGASPEDVERLVTLPLEDELEDFDGLDEMSSRSQEGLSVITLTVAADADVSDFLEDARAAVDREDELPEDVEDPVVDEIENEFPAIAVYIYGNASDEELREIAERHQHALEALPGVSSVDLAGTREPRVWIEVDPLALERFDLTLEEVGLRVGTRSRDAPLGSLATGSGDYLLRVDAGLSGADELREFPLVTRPDGTIVRLSDVARVHDTWERARALARFNGEPTLRLQLNKSARGDSITISELTYAYIEREAELLPPGVEMGANSDLSVYVRNRLRVMSNSAMLGGFLVLVSLVLFLSARVAFWTAVGIPVAFLAGLLAAGLLGITMNMVTMFALIVVLGMIVDDAIVVGENVFRLMEEGLPPKEAAIRGVAQVGKPVTATILTTMAAFGPILMIGGTMGEFMRPLPVIVTFCLAASLIEALVVLPCHLAHGAREEGEQAREPGARWYDPLQRAYVRVLELAIRWRWVTLGTTLAATIAAGGVAFLRMDFVLFDEFESKVFYVNLRAPADSSLEETERAALPVQELVHQLPEAELESSNLLVGVSYADSTRFSVGQHLAQVWVELREDRVGRRPTSEIIEDLRGRLDPPPPGIETVDVDQPQAGPVGKAIDVSIRGPELAVLLELAAELRADLETFAGVRDVRDNAERGKREIRLELTDEGRTLGFSEAGLARELRAAFEGTRFGRLRRGSDDVEIIVKLPEELRSERGALERLRVTSPTGARVPLRAAARVVESSGLAVVTRDEGERSVRVTADVNGDEGNSQDITAAMKEKWAGLELVRPGYSLLWQGDDEDTAESMEGLRLSAIVALLLIYLVLGTLFRSLTQPFVIMFAIPFSTIGMILGHVVMGRILSFMSFVGLLALAGVVVNDSLILVDFVNQRRREGMGLVPALIDAGRMRFRPILLTSLTTMLGLTPLTFFASGQARFLQPMAITMFFGLAAGTFLILLVVPAAYGALEDVLALARRPFSTARKLWRDEPVHDPGGVPPRLESPSQP